MLHPNLKFTQEIEDSKGQIAFLDMKLHHKDTRIESSWFTKPTNSGLTLNYHAIAPTKYKRSVIRSFVHRISNSCSTWEYFHEGLERAKEILSDNQYPLPFYDPLIHETSTKILSKQIADKPCFSEAVTGKRLFFVQYRRPESSKYRSV